MMNSSPTKPTRTPAIGPIKGNPAIKAAIDAPVTAKTSGGTLSSIAIVVATICTSSRNQFGNKGRMGRSIRRQIRVAFSGGRPSRRKKPPGIRPAAYRRSS